MASRLLSFWVLCAGMVCGIWRLTAGFQWQNEETLIVNSCVGSRANIPWKFSKMPNESVGTIHWFRFSRETVASLVDGKITNPNRRFAPSGSNAEMSIAGLTVRDTGHYEVDVKVFSKDSHGDQSEVVHTASAVLTVGDPPSISGEKLTIEEVSSNEACALRRQVTLRCGHFTKRGVPPVDVVWVDPAGQQLPSSRYADGTFDLDLPRRPLAGNYTCHVLCQSPILHCLAPNSPLLASPRIHLRSPSSDGCTEADRWVPEEDPDSAPTSEAVRRLKSNLTDLQGSLNTLREEQAQLKEESEHREENFRVKVEELRELVLLSNQQSSGAQLQGLQQSVQDLQYKLHQVQQNLTSLQQGRDHNQKEQRGQEHDQRIQDVLNTFKDLQNKVSQNDKTIASIEEKVVTLAVGLSLAENSLISLQDALNVNVEGQGLSELHALNITDLWRNLNRLEELHSDTLDELREVSEAQKTCERRQENVTRSLSAMSSRVDGVERGLGRRVDRAVSQCNATRSELGKLGWRLQRVENGQPSSVGEERVMEPEIDPLVSKAEPTFSLFSPWDEESDSLMHDFVITPDGQVVIADRHHAYVIMAPNVSLGDATTLPLRHGSHIRRLTNMDNGLIAATVDDHYIYILDTTTADPSAQQRWVRTSHTYHGIAARSAQTLFVGVDSGEAGGEARVDVISIVDDLAADVSTVLTKTTTPELKMPAALTVHDDTLYVCDWESSSIIRLSLQTLEVTVLRGPRAQPELQFFQPRQTAFDVSGNMYVTTGGKLCGGMGDYVYARGFCVVVISQEGWWDRLITRGQHIYPYGLALTPTGLAVSWGSWVSSPLRSLIQWYDLVQPNA